LKPCYCTVHVYDNHKVNRQCLRSINNIVLLRDVFHIGLVIGPRPAVLAWGAAECQYSRPRTYNYANMKNTIPVNPITARSESTRYFDNCKEKSRAILDWLINNGIITWCFSYWHSYRSSVCCIGIPMKVFILYWQIWPYIG
jgi:hypothetical protein